METAPFVVPAYSTASLLLVGILASTFFIAAIISFLYWINTRIRRGMKESHDDWRVEQDIDSGHTLHAEGIFGTRHPEEGGIHLKQEDPHSPLAGLKTGIKHKHRMEPDDKLFESQNRRSVP